jgi:hypothetical protein
MCSAWFNSFPGNSFPVGTNRGLGTNYLNKINDLIRSQRIRSQEILGTNYSNEINNLIRSQKCSLKRGGFVGNEFPPRHLWPARKPHHRTHTHRRSVAGLRAAR